MTIEECYKSLGGDYSNVLSRLSSDAIIRKFLVKFLSDSSCSNIFSNLESGNIEEAFRAAHTLKGICQNLGMDNLYRSAFDVTEALRSGSDNTDEKMLERLKVDYAAAVDAIKQMSC